MSSSLAAPLPGPFAAAFSAHSKGDDHHAGGHGHDSSHGGHGHDEDPGGGIALPALVCALVLGGILWFFMNNNAPVPHTASHAAQEAGHAAQDAGHAVAGAAGHAADAAKETASSLWAALGELFQRKLPNGVELNIPRLGVETRIVDFIEDSARPVDKTTWFDFDRLLFDTGKATLQPASQEQLSNVAAILKAFPKVHVKIGGYTDNTGNAAANKKLSSERASTVMFELIRLGVEAARLESEGYGQEHPIADNATEEGRQKNRRVSLRVTEK